MEDEIKQELIESTINLNSWFWWCNRKAKIERLKKAINLGSPLLQHNFPLKNREEFVKIQLEAERVYLAKACI